MLNYDTEQAVANATNLLIQKGLTIAFAESATAGCMAAEFSIAKSAGKCLKGGLVCYDANLKTDILNVPQELIDRCTPESMEVTEGIARGLVSLIPADIHIGITGLPCEGGSETPEKPVGTMFIYAIYKGRKLFEDRKVFQGSQREVLNHTVDHVASLLIKKLS